MKQFYVYILCDRPYGSLYVGVTSNLVQRVYQHRHKVMDSYTSRRNIHRLVYYEPHEKAEHAFASEKRLKRWPRAWKFNLIERDNPHWGDLDQQPL